ncbi:MAG: hypothetical protein OXU31_03615, partial [Gammaproteobacteria bacterium]|nr:hypothetical protein [Gammaproteobacteria bacterium]
MSSEHPPAAQFDAGKKFNQGAVSLSAQDRLRFAKQALCVLALICIGVFIGYARFPDNSALIAIFELVKIGVLPLVTLVVSFYFP